VDMDSRQQTSIILGAPFLKSVKVAINERKKNINMKVERKHEKFTFHPQNPAYFYQVHFHHHDSNKVEYVDVLPYEPERLKRSGSSQSKELENDKTPRMKSNTTNYSKLKSIWCIKNATQTAPPSPVTTN
jgi:hypothetical protein